jgi:kynurenine formamidase
MKFLALFLLSIMSLTTLQAKSTGKIIDLTYAFDADSVYWPTAETFKLETDFEGVTDKGYFYSAYRFSAAEHGGTHLDAPVHFAKGHNSVDQIPLEQLTGAGLVIDVTKQCAANVDYLVSVADFQDWEKRNGRIPVGAIVLLRTGFGKFYPDRKKYLERTSGERRLSQSFISRAWIHRQRVG